jgi:APA family basic amino acid/polyamine antiporter
MSDELERGLGLYSAVTLSMGAMIGGGIFVLPAIGFKMARRAVVVAYLLAGLIVLPNALSKAEMATAMPQDGGTYLDIDRAMGPLMGTIAGLGMWFSLVFKSAFALVGLGAYLLLLVDLTAGAVKLVALALGAFIILLNVIGTEKTGQLQGLIVGIVLAGLGGYVLDGVRLADLGRDGPETDRQQAGLPLCGEAPSSRQGGCHFSMGEVETRLLKRNTATRIDVVGSRSPGQKVTSATAPRGSLGLN